MLHVYNSLRPSLACVALVALLATPAHADVLSHLPAQIQPLAQARNQSIRIVLSAKRDLGADGINVLNLKYAALQTSANNYLGSVVEAVNTGSLDTQESRENALALKKAIKGFNGSIRPLVISKVNGAPATPSRVALPLSDKWVDAIEKRLGTSWPRYKHELAMMTLNQRVALAEQLKHAFAWPEFQDIQR